MGKTTSINSGVEKFGEYMPGLADILSNYDTKTLMAALSQLQQFTPAMVDVQGRERARQLDQDTSILRDQVPSYAAAYNNAQALLDPQFTKLADQFTTSSADATKQYKDLLGTYNIAGGLSEAEKESVSRETNKKNVASGNLNRDSALRTIGNAMNYGDRLDKKRSTFGNLLGQFGNMTSQFGSVAPNFKSGINASQLPSLYGAGGNAVGTAIGNVMNNRALGQGVLNTFVNNVQQPMSDLQKISTSVGIGGELLGGVAKGLGLCWVAREVYGEWNPKWLQFRDWVIMDAPPWFFRLYRKYGERVAAFIRNKPWLKNIIRRWMDTKIK